MIRDFLRPILPERFRPSAYLERLVRSRTGATVNSGPFAGLKYVHGRRGRAHLPTLLGTYERELYPYVEHACVLNLCSIIVIGAAEGYYAIGMSRRNPGARVIAFEMDAQRRESLAKMARINRVESRIEIYGKCEPVDLAKTLADTQRALVICDVEGDESALLNPATLPSLRHAFILVELHEFIERGISEIISARFRETHRIDQIWQSDRTSADFPFRTFYTRLLPNKYLRWAVNESRPERMSWFWMEPRFQDGA